MTMATEIVQLKERMRLLEARVKALTEVVEVVHIYLQEAEINEAVTATHLTILMQHLQNLHM